MVASLWLTSLRRMRYSALWHEETGGGRTSRSSPFETAMRSGRVSDVQSWLAALERRAPELRPALDRAAGTRPPPLRRLRSHEGGRIDSTKPGKLPLTLGVR